MSGTYSKRAAVVNEALVTITHCDGSSDSRSRVNAEPCKDTAALADAPAGLARVAFAHPCDGALSALMRGRVAPRRQRRLSVDC